MATEEPVTVVLDTGEIYEGRIQLTESGAIQVLRDQDPTPVMITLNSVKAIKSSKQETAAGEAAGFAGHRGFGVA